MTGPLLQLNDFQRNSLLAGFKYIDGLIGEGVTGMSPSNEEAIFASTFPDATPVQQKVIGDQVSRLRRAVRAALDVFAITVSPPEIGAIRNLRAMLMSIDITLDEIGPEHLRGYGELAPEAAAGVSAALAQIRTVLTELQAYALSGLGGDLAARLDRLDQTRDEVRLLREIERIITSHGVVELRGALTRLLGRLEKNWWTVAFIGRVSSGKSSLLNYLLETDVLPAGVTPITAVPIRIVPGSAAAATVYFGAEKPRKIPAGGLDEFASEERNPGNGRLVTDILLELPASRLGGDMCFVDTPGLGSLATAGSAQTMAFLPRCDLGVLLLDAVTTPSEEDIAVARTLLEDGAEVLLVLSKADLLGPVDREKMLSYARRQFSTRLGRELTVAPVSVALGNTALTDQWFAVDLAPRQVVHRELAATALRRKVGALREATAAALARRAGSVLAPASPLATGDTAALGVARAAIETHRRDLHDLADRATPDCETVIDTIARVLVDTPDDCAAENHFRDAVARELGRMAARLAAEFDTRLRATRDTAERSLCAASGQKLSGAELPRAHARPLFDPAILLGSARLSNAWGRLPTALFRRAALRRHLRAQLGDILDDALRGYARTLVRWSERYLDHLADRFNAEAGVAESRIVVPRTPIEHAEGLKRDQELLSHWDQQTSRA